MDLVNELNHSSTVSTQVHNLLESKDLYSDKYDIFSNSASDNIVIKRISEINIFRKRLFEESEELKKMRKVHGVWSDIINFGIKSNYNFLTAVEGLFYLDFFFIKNLFTTKKYNRNGIYELTFCINEKWVKVVVDDQVALKKDDENDCYFSYLKDSLWLLILEKVYISVVGYVNYLKTNDIFCIIQHLTGTTSYELLLDKMKFSEIYTLFNCKNLVMFTEVNPRYKKFVRNDDCDFLSINSVKLRNKKFKVITLNNTFNTFSLPKKKRFEFGILEKLEFGVVNDNLITLKWEKFKKLFYKVVVFPLLHWHQNRQMFWDHICMKVHIEETTKLIVNLTQFRDNHINFKVFDNKYIYYISEVSNKRKMKSDHILLQPGVYYISCSIYEKGNYSVLTIFSSNKIEKHYVEKSKTSKKRIEKFFFKNLPSIFTTPNTDVESMSIDDGSNSFVIKIIEIGFDVLLTLFVRGKSMKFDKLELFLKKGENLFVVYGGLNYELYSDDIKKRGLFLCHFSRINRLQNTENNFKVNYKIHNIC